MIGGVKALACGYCGDIRALGHGEGGLRGWVSCGCGMTQARWVDPYRGTAEFKVPPLPTPFRCFLLGLNNHVLEPALRGELGMHQDFREAHERATDAPNHVFDKSRAGCWAVVARVGTTSDVTWAAPDSDTETAPV